MTETTDALERLLARECGSGEDADAVPDSADAEARVETLEALAAPDGVDPERAVAALSALGDRTRYRIVTALVAADRELCVCEVTPVVDVGSSATSHALRELREAGLVERRKDGNWRYYRATDRARALLEALAATAATAPTDGAGADADGAVEEAADASAPAGGPPEPTEGGR